MAGIRAKGITIAAKTNSRHYNDAAEVNLIHYPEGGGRVEVLAWEYGPDGKLTTPVLATYALLDVVSILSYTDAARAKDAQP